MEGQTSSTPPPRPGHGIDDDIAKDNKKLSPTVFHVPPTTEEETNSETSDNAWQDIAKEAAEQTGGSHQDTPQGPTLPAVIASTSAPPRQFTYAAMDWEEGFFTHDRDELIARHAEECGFGGLFDEDNSPYGVPAIPENSLAGRHRPPSSRSASPTQFQERNPPLKMPFTPVRNMNPLQGATNNKAPTSILSPPSRASTHRALLRSTFSPESTIRSTTASPASSAGTAELPPTPTPARRRSTLHPKTNAKVAFFESLEKNKKDIELRFPGR